MSSEADSTLPVTTAAAPRTISKTFSRNVVFSLTRMAVNAWISLILPAYLTHHLSVKAYGAWVLILQLSGYVAFLDFGVQTAVSKYVAEYEAKGDIEGAGQRASAGFLITVLASVFGVLLVLGLVWRVPHLFHEMPAPLYRDVRIGLVLVGTSLAFTLGSSIFSAVFSGLQRYSVPMITSMINRALFTIVACTVAFRHGSLAAMGAGVAIVNVSTALVQIVAWRRLASHIRVSLFGIDRAVLKTVLAYCSVLAIWQVGMLCVSGLDVTIVGRYDFTETAYYSIAILPTNLILLIMVSVLRTLMPAASALSTQRSPAEMGNMLARTTRYSTTLLFLTGLPLIVGGFQILRWWVGETYAFHSIQYLRILILANIIRNICLPYATVVVATGQQRFATAAAIAEAVVNLVASIFLASRMGAIGVAIGTLLGSIVSISMHFVLSMRNTSKTLEVRRLYLFADGIMRPAIMAVPTIVLFPQWYLSKPPFLSPGLCVIWGVSTLLLAWFGSLHSEDRHKLAFAVRERIHTMYR